MNFASRRYWILHYIALTIIIVLAIFLRIHNIDNAPPGIYPDEANNGTNAYDAQESGHYQWFYPDNNGREGLYINMLALMFKYFGVSMLTLKSISILFGVLTAIGIYLLTRELFYRSPHIALIASYLSAVSFWSINFSRIGFRAIMLPAVLCFAFYFLFRGLRLWRANRAAQKNGVTRTQPTDDFTAVFIVNPLRAIIYSPYISYALAGFIFGLGMHTYIAFRIAPALLITTLIALLIVRARFVKNHWKAIFLFIAFTFLSAAPMFLTYYQNPEFLGARTGDVSIFSPTVNDGNFFGTLGKTISLSLGKFNFYGDPNWRHGYPPYPTLEPVVGIAFAFGLIYALIQFFTLAHKTIRTRKKTTSTIPAPLVVYTLLLSWFFALLAPEFFTAEGLPHALRSIGTLPVVYILAAVTFGFVLRAAHNHSAARENIVFACTCVALIYIGFFGAVKYHVFWTHHPRVAPSFDKSLTDIARAIPSVPIGQQKYVIAGPLERLPVRLLNTNTENLTFLYEDQIDTIDPTQSFIIFLAENNEHIAHTLQERFPNHSLRTEHRVNSSFFVLE